MPLCCLKQHRNPLGKIWCTECTSLIAGAAIGDYVIDSHLGQGTSAAVYLAHLPKLNNCKVVIRVLHSVTSQESIDNFRKEAAVLASLSHPYILPIYDYGIIEEVRVDQMGNYNYSPYLVLQYAEHGSLDEIFKQEGNRPWSLERILPIIKEAAEALDHAHLRSILHRDVKPANILMLGSRIVLADFGVADLIDVDMSHLDAPWAGSPAYMAPEVWRYKPGRYSDQYALAVTCFRLLTGEYPWKIATGGTAQWMHVHQYVAPYSLRTYRPDLPMAVGLVLQRALSKEPHDRYPSVGTFATELRKAAQDETQQLASPSRLTLPARPPMEAAPSPVLGSEEQAAQVQVEKAQPAARHLNGNGSTSSIQPFFEEEQQNGEDPIGKIDITGSLTREISQKLQSSRWTLPAFIFDRGRRRTEAETTTKSLLSLFALARATLENDDKAYIGKTYAVQAGISRRKFRSFKALPFDLFVPNVHELIQFDISLHASDNIELTSEWQKYLRYDPQNTKPQLVEFPFKVITPGPCSLTVDFYRERHLLQTINIVFEAIEQPTLATAAVEG